MNNEQRISVKTKTGYLKALVIDEDKEHPAIYVCFCPNKGDEEFPVAMIESKQADYDMDTKNMHVHLYEDVNVDDWTMHVAIPIKRD